MRRTNARWLAAAIAVGAGIAIPAHALSPVDILTAPKTLIDRAIEARSAADITKDNEIVIEVNRIMAEFGTIKASTEIYEQRLLVTGLFDDKALHDRFQTAVKGVKGVRKLYWHVLLMSKAEQERNKAKMIDWPDAVVLDNKAGLRLVGARGVADVNYRIAADAMASVYVIGRARSKEEAEKAIAVLRTTEGAKKIVNYIDVRP